jgi:adenylate cyclase class 2
VSAIYSLRRANIDPNPADNRARLDGNRQVIHDRDSAGTALREKCHAVDHAGTVSYGGIMSFEVEQKFRSASHAEVAARLATLGAQPGEEIAQVDLYLNHPSRDFAETGEALRIRQVGAGNAITYKGPRLAGPTKTRPEHEVAFAAGPVAFETLRKVFLKLGFRPVAEVHKRRTTYHLSLLGRPLEVVLDQVDGLGAFVEVEAIAEDDADLPSAQAAVQELARQIGLTDLEPRSYLRMILELRASVADGA